MNNRGYLLVEIIVACTIAMVILYFLVNITVELKNTNEDYYLKTKLETDKMIISNAIMKDIIDYDLTVIDNGSGAGGEYIIYFNPPNYDPQVDSHGELTIKNNIITYCPYGSVNENSCIKKDYNMSKLTISNSFQTEFLSGTGSSDSAYLINIPIINPFDGEDYGIHLEILK